MYKPKYFHVQELVPKSIYDQRKEKSIELIDERVLITLDQLREYFGICTINNWKSVIQDNQCFAAVVIKLVYVNISHDC